MPVQKSNVNVNFGQGLDTKTDPNQVQLGKFLSMQNSVFTTGGRLTKRNGYGPLASLPNDTSSFLTTYNGDLTAIGTHLEAYTATAEQWYDRGSIQPVLLETETLIRNNTNQSQVDTAFSPTGFTCTVYTDQDPASLMTSIYRYTISDTETGQTIISPTTITSADAEFGTPKVFLLGMYFIIVYTNKVSATYHLKYIAVQTSNPSIVGSPVDISTNYTPSSTVNFDGHVLNNSLFIAWNGATSSGIHLTTLTNSLSLSSALTPDPSHEATLMSVTSDSQSQLVWVSYYDLGTTTGYAFAVNALTATILAPTQIITTDMVLNLTATAQDSILTFYYEVSNAYSYDSGIPTNFVRINTLTLAGTLGTPSVLKRSVGLASKAFLYNGKSYVQTVYSSPYQPTFFLIDQSGNIIQKLAYGNAGGYLTLGLPSSTVNSDTVKIPYVLRDLIQAVNKNTNVPAGNQVNGVYSQTGLNLASSTITTDSIETAEIALNLNISGGFLWNYDGYTPVENNFFVWPDSIEATWSDTGGAIVAKPDGTTNTDAYFYQVTYEWTDNQGNPSRSAPSIPISVTTTGSGTAGTITIVGPMLRLTYKVANPVKIVIYRWSVAQEIYYQVTSITEPVLNDPTTDSFTFMDTLADASILGNNILYTTGGVLEDISPPAFDSVFLFDDRLWGIDSEDKNLLWYSKQVIETTPVEMSDLLTLFVAPSIGAQGSTGPLRCGASMDDKLILFKASAINYINGNGPDNTGANNQYSQPIFITSTVGCSNQKSIVFQPQGLMFEFASEAGNQIWLLGRDLSTRYIGADVEGLTQHATVQSAVNIPGTNEVRFTLNSGITIKFDYYYNQWDTDVNIPAVSSTLYQGVHAYINSLGQVFQETPGIYLDGSSPVLMSFTTSWIHLADIQGYQRAYFFYLLATYASPHKLNVQIAYDYDPSPTQQVIITPMNFSPVYGADLTYGSGTPYGGAPRREQWRVGLTRQRCQAFQITLTEIYDPIYQVPAGAGLTISGINVVVGIKKGYRPIRADQTVGSS